MAFTALGVAVLLFIAQMTAMAAELSLDLHHKFSNKVRQWVESHRVDNNGVSWWPEYGTVEYYATLASHDRTLHRRLLGDESYEKLTFVNGNETVKIQYLYYTVIALGMPSRTFLVALDTGSSLLWVPCNCNQCASLDIRNLVFDTYDPSRSSTSQLVSCSSSLCNKQDACPGDGCLYTIEYASDNTSSSGVLVEDILYLTTGDPAQKIIKAPIIFGCGELQTGLFLKGVASNGLLGLGTQSISVPSILSSKGLIADSFSMCFGDDGNGRITFGDKGSLGQQETALIDSNYGYYKINITGIVVGNSSIPTEFTAIVDSGTSFTYLADPMYTELTQIFDSQVQEQRTDQNHTFEYCYDLSNFEAIFPQINLITVGGSIFPVNVPHVFFSSEQTIFYCLAVLKTTQQNIIGQNFLTGLRIVFDREMSMLGWKNFDCNNVESNSSTSGETPGSSSTKTSTIGSNITEVAVPVSFHNSSNSLHLNSFTSTSMLLLLLSLTIL